MLKKKLVVVVSIVLWLAGFSYGSGLGKAYNVYEWTCATTACALAILFLKGRKYRLISLSRLLLIVFILLVSLYHTAVFGSNLLGYYWLFLLPPCFKALFLEKQQMWTISIVFGILGLVVLIVATTTSVLKGWDNNSISVPCFFSFSVFAGSFFERKKKRHLILFSLYSLIFIGLLIKLISRSSIFFSIILILSVLCVLPIKKIVQGRWLAFLLLTPLFLAILVALIRNASLVSVLETWSEKTFSKSFFNGRDSLWWLGFVEWTKHPVLGNGSFSGNWHNSAITLLVGSGLVGYILYLLFVGTILKQGIRYAEDPIMAGLVYAFLVIWMQQSVELGLVGMQGNVIPFIVLGLIVSYGNTIAERGRSSGSDVHYNSSL